MTDPIPARLAALKTMALPELKAEWRTLFGAEPPGYNRRYLESRLAYRIQEFAYGGLKPETRKRLEALGEQFADRNITRRRLRARQSTQVSESTRDSSLHFLPHQSGHAKRPRRRVA